MKKWSVVLALLAIVLSSTGASATLLLYEDFEDYPVGWEFYGEVMGEPLSLWHGETLRSVSGNMSAAYNTGMFIDPYYSVEIGPNWGMLLSPSLDLTDYTGVMLDFYSWVSSGVDELAIAFIGVGGDEYPFPPINWITPHEQWNHLFADLSPLGGMSDVRIGFFYENLTYDGCGCFAGEGWYIDDVRVRACGGDPVPEPSTLMLLMSGLAGVGVVARRRFTK